MNPVRVVYLDTCAVSLELLANPVVAQRWGQESVLPEFSTGGLAGHLARSTLQVEWFLDAVEPTDEPITAVEYYARLEGVHDRNSELNVGVRARSDEMASLGSAALTEAVRDALDRLRRRLPNVASRRVSTHAADRADGAHRRPGVERGGARARSTERRLFLRHRDAGECGAIETR
jgi:Mycothiol maleylpyruvate isomerase N-terminal domain